MRKILLLDDEPHIREDLGRRLEIEGCVVYKAATIEDAKKLILSEPIECAIVDLKVDFRSEHGGIEVVTALKRHQPRAKAIVLSCYNLAEVSLTKAETAEIDALVLKNGPTNYITAVLEQLGLLSRQHNKRSCFVIMPFSATASCSDEEWTEVFTALIRPAVEQAGFEYDCRRSDALQGSIIEDILDNLNRADLVIADLTDRNPNVFYELGVRHTLSDSTILIAQRLTDIPFDLRHYAIQIYGWKTDKARVDFKEKIKDVIGRIIADPVKGASPVRKYLRL